MYFTNITLRDWKSYTTAHFVFPAPASERNIILIGAPNGYGKTSLFEAIVLGLFGRDGLPLIARSPFTGVGEERLATNYKSFLEKALHRGALQAGRNSCSVKLTFVDDEEQPIELQRVWYFSDNGTYRPQDEEVHIYEGPTRKPVGPNGLQANERIEWYRDYVARQFLPYYLAAFFLFDGEQVSAFAEREMAAQVRTGIEGLLGIPVLKELAEDLRAYARVRRAASPNVSDRTIERLELDRDALKEQLDLANARSEEIDPTLQNLKEERERLTRELASFGAGSQAQLQEQLERLNHHRREIDDARERLDELLATDLALALAGKSLRATTALRLYSETIREKWESGKQQGDQNLERFLDKLAGGLRQIAPALLADQHQGILEQASRSWEALWYPPPENCAEGYRHKYLNDLERGKTLDTLRDLDHLAAPRIMEVLNTISANEDAARRLQDEITRTEAVAPQIDKKRERLSTINGEIQGYDQEIGALKREIVSVTSQINMKNQEITRLSNQLDQAQPSIRRATRALAVAGMVDEIVASAVPSQIDAIARAMTSAHHSMAHKKDLIEKIVISEDCDVHLLDSTGIDIRNFDLSAGEKQIFTQALIAAVASVSGRLFPMVVDTPLGRLDVEHRKGVLRHLVGRGHQVILLSTNTEVVGEYLTLIEPHVQKTYRITFERIGEVGQSIPIEGYFEEQEVAA